MDAFSMTGLWLQDQTLSLRQDLPIPEPGPGEALVRMRLAGICSTDLEMVRGYYPFQGICGHEFVGEIVRTEQEPQRVGQRVVGEINLVCHTCPACQSGRPTHCENRRTLGIHDKDGVFAEYLTLPLENLHPIPPAVSDAVAVFTEPIAAALEIQEQVQIRPMDRVLLVGAGRLGLLIAQTLRLTGCDLGVVVRHMRQRQLLNHFHIPALTEEEALRHQWDVVVEATGSEAGFALARQAVRPRGTIVLKSTYKGEVQVNFSAIVVEEITLLGSRCGPFPPALRLMQQGLVDPTLLIEGTFALDEGLEAFQCAARPGVLKVLLKNNGQGEAGLNGSEI